MEISKEALIVSKITREHIGLIYQTPREVQKAIDEDRALISYYDEQPAIFCLWDFYGEWCEINTLYADHKLRKKIPVLKKVYEELKNELGSMTKKAVVFTRHPAVARMIRLIGFKKTSVWKLPWSLLLKLLFHRLHPNRLVSYTKYGWKIIFVRWKMYVRKSP